jgi:hypothetical protein
VLENSIYVVGGWTMSGGEEPAWHGTAHVLELGAERPTWRAIAKPPFERRALSLAAHDGRIYAVGGMRSDGDPTTEVDVFDPAANTWSQGPPLVGEGMDGFGSSAYAAGGRLYVSTYSGTLQRLTKDGQSWEVVRQLPRARFFHRMLPLSDAQLLLLGGASMETGKFAELDVVDVR